MTRRVETRTSRTAEWTCLCRAMSALERRPAYQGGDYLAPRLLPVPVRLLSSVGPLRRLFLRLAAPRGIYEYVIARTRFMDHVFRGALQRGARQVVIMGAGFDTRAERFQDLAAGARIFEMDAPATQRAKTGQLARRGIPLPANLHLVPIDFEKQSPAGELARAGFDPGQQTLFMLEGVLMYLEPASVEATLEMIRGLCPPGGELAFDFVHASVLRGQGELYGQEKIVRSTKKAGEGWRWGLEAPLAGEFLARRGFQLAELLDAEALERRWFGGTDHGPLARINATHCLVRAVRRA